MRPQLPPAGCTEGGRYPEREVTTTARREGTQNLGQFFVRQGWMMVKMITDDITSCGPVHFETVSNNHRPRLVSESSRCKVGPGTVASALSVKELEQHLQRRKREVAEAWLCNFSPPIRPTAPPPPALSIGHLGLKNPRWRKLGCAISARLLDP